MKQIVLARLVQIAAAFTILALPGLAQADIVTNFHSDVKVSRDNVVTVKETISYDPQDQSHHGIYRFVPAQFKDKDGHRYYTQIKLISVVNENGQNHPLAESRVNNRQLYLKIGDAEHTITGPQTYIITYQIKPLVIKGETGDRFIFNITGEQWETSIQQASATITFDEKTSLTGANCYTGVTGSTASNCIASSGGFSATAATTKPLNIKEGFTVDLRSSSGSVSTYLMPDKPLPFTNTQKILFALIVLGLIVLLTALSRIVWAWWKERSERKAQTIIPLYEPPSELKPAQLSVLESPQSDVADITATIIDLAVRGYIKIEQIQAKTWFRQANYRFTVLKPLTGLATFESLLSEALFKGSSSVELKNLRSKSTTISSAVQAMRSELGKDLKAKGYFDTSPSQAWSVARIVFLGIGIFMLGLALLDVLDDGGAGSGILIALGFAAAFASYGLTFVKTGRTLVGNQEWAKVTGFKWFLSVTEKDRLAFTDAPDKTPELFSAMLPYAIALKVEKQWAKQFEGIDVGQVVGGWYGGYSGALFASSFTNDFSSSFGGAMSSSFAGSSGGGSSGGGGGGGGGGGW